MGILSHLQPERVFYYFEEISKIPRESYHEKEISDYLVRFAKERNLEVYQDSAYNVIIRKKASPAYENSKGVILQGHMDMVCEKEEGSQHDFQKDPLQLRIEGNYIKATDTTLGADNGIAIAMGLAILEDEDAKHPALELLVTTSEEIDLGGAMALEAGKLKGSYLINIDSEEEGFVTVGSAGGECIRIELPMEKINIRSPFAYRIKIQNFLGGHSGVEIHKQRGNANKAMVEVLDLLKERVDFHLMDVSGGRKDNAIPRAAEALIASEEKIEDSLREVLAEVKAMYQEFETQVDLGFEEIINDYEAFSEDSFYKYINLMEEIPTGVYTWMKDYPDIVEASDNLAIVKVEEDILQVQVSLRSSDPEVLERLKQHLANIALKYGASYEFHSAYPAWKYRRDSVLREKALEIWKEMTGKEMEVAIIHAGLECGAIAQTYPDLDFISIGPNLYDVHTPEEKLDIASTAKIYQYLQALLASLK